MSATLTPCPFCENRNLTLYDERVTPRVVFIFCTSCEMHGPEATTVEGAKDAWNARAGNVDAAPAMLEALRHMVGEFQRRGPDGLPRVEKFGAIVEARAVLAAIDKGE